MHRLADKREQFITLLAHADSDLPPSLPSGDLFGSSFVLTGTENETSTELTSRLFNLIIIDLDLACLNLIALAKTKGCINYHTPIIALLDEHNFSQKSSLIAAGFDDCLVKPLTIENLGDAINLWRDNDVLVSFFESIQTLLSIFRNNKAVVLTLYRKLFDELPQQIEQIENAINTGQYHLAIDATHHINASAKICYLKNIGNIANDLETCLNHKKYGLVETYFSLLQKDISTLINHRLSILEHLER